MGSNLIDSLFFDCKNGDRRAQKELFNRTAQTMLGLCYRYAKNTEDAEDILQNGYIKVFKNLHSFKQNGSFEGWIKKIMINTAITYYRQSKNDPYTTDYTEIENSMSSNDFSIIQTMEYQELLELVQSLPEKYRLVFNLYLIEGYSHQEIADLLEISENTSKSQLFRAREILKNKILKREEETYVIQ